MKLRLSNVDYDAVVKGLEHRVGATGVTDLTETYNEWRRKCGKEPVGEEAETVARCQVDMADRKLRPVDKPCPGCGSPIVAEKKSRGGEFLYCLRKECGWREDPGQET